MMRRILLISTILLIGLMAQAQTFQWANQFSSPGTNQAVNIVEGPTGYLYVSGDFEGTVDFDPGEGALYLTSFGGMDIFIEKMDADSKLIWVKQLGGIDDDIVRNINCDADGNVYLTGAFIGVADMDPGDSTYYLQSLGGKDIFLAELDKNGNFVWAGNMGGTQDETGTSIGIAPSGNIYLAGYYIGTVDFDPVDTTSYNLTSVSQDIFVEKLDANHNFLWAKTMGGPQFDYCMGLCIDGEENIYTTGLFKGKDDFDPGDSAVYLVSAGAYGMYDMYVNKLNSSGEYVWAKQISGPENETSTGLAYDHAGSLYFTGYFQGTVDFDPDTSSFYMTSAGGFDIFTGKMDTSGKLIWAKQMGGLGDQGGQALALDHLGNVYTTGHFKETSDFNPGNGTYELTSAGDYDIFVSKLDTTGNFVWAAGMGGAYFDRGLGITTDEQSNIYTTGWFKGTADFDPGPDTFYLNGTGDYDAFVCKLGTATMGVHEAQTENTIRAFPNPIQNTVNIELGKLYSEINATIFDIQGREIIRQTFNNLNKISMRINAKAGLYFVRITTNEGALGTIKMVKQ